MAFDQTAFNTAKKDNATLRVTRKIPTVSFFTRAQLQAQRQSIVARDAADHQQRLDEIAEIDYMIDQMDSLGIQ